MPRWVYVAILHAVLHSALWSMPKSTPKRRISVDEARILVMEILSGSEQGVDIIYSPRDFDPEFFFFALINTSAVGDLSLGYVAVNPSTGDVWRTAGKCERVLTPILKRHQKEIRKRLALAKADYEKFHEKRPLCDAGVDPLVTKPGRR